MKRGFLLLGLLLVAAISMGGLAYFTIGPVAIIFGLFGPNHNFDPASNVAAPDYGRMESWAARPEKDSFANYVPKGIARDANAKPADVFFIHPTGFLVGSNWNSPLNPDSRTEENTKWMMANQASSYNSCCDVYAPRYREASIFRYLGASPSNVEKAMDLAYSDVERAFIYYLEHDNHGRPFIIASHSQGTEHAFRLIREQLDGKPISSQMVAAYLIGNQLMTNLKAAELKNIPVCDRPEQIGCIIHWATYAEGVTPNGDLANPMVCVNPLSWRRDGARVDAGSHLGGVPISGKFSIKIWGSDAPQGMMFSALDAPVSQLTWAECRNGVLYVIDLRKSVFGVLELGRAGNYHGLDYPLFHMDIRQNARARLAAFANAIGAPHQ